MPVIELDMSTLKGRRAAEVERMRPLAQTLGIADVNRYLAMLMALSAAGYDTLESLRSATDEQLLSVYGVGATRLALIRKATTLPTC